MTPGGSPKDKKGSSGVEGAPGRSYHTNYNPRYSTGDSSPIPPRPDSMRAYVGVSDGLRTGGHDTDSVLKRPSYYNIAPIVLMRLAEEAKESLASE